MPYISLILILFSTLGLFFIVGMKVSEVNTGKSGMFARISGISDPILRRKLDAGSKVLGYINASNIRRFLRFFTSSLFHVFGTAGLFVSKHHVSFMRWIRGRRYIKGGGVVSFFLKNVSESKEEKGKKDV
ncbi:MAG: hypothetical protein UY44_C0001G0029 [Candidatus Kaiserbacteria bacterium GW2011_GWA2_49_19]|uniref:Uncharacterized protein n=1 Tax=Candidatus Kaiserbacteria bacterium GW2011_GWA2_49_19 TaxID=1618669 RepID=A0A0G1YSV6_9BACT|nr:MAG: hypothetical protein UY44_C0001G0029 [Candidatus Kaiserbacteria bacterium GW2011_GWA2_49_19]